MRLRQGPVREVFVEDGRAAVFVDAQVVVLSEIATAILEAVGSARSGTTLDEVTRAVVEEFGEPEPPYNAADLTLRQVLDLVSYRILVDGTPTATHTPASVSALREALRHITSDTIGTWRLPTEVSGAEFVAACHRHRVMPTVAANLDRLDLPLEASSAISATTAQEAATVSRLASELAQICTTLTQRGVQVMAVKGLALAVQAHGRVDARGTGDHDLLVAPEDVHRAHSVLVSLGWSQLSGQPTPGDSYAWRHFIRNHYELQMQTANSRLDLHWHLSDARGSLPTFAELWSRRATVTIAGAPVPTLSPYDALVHVADHSAGDAWGWMRGLLDAHRLMSDPITWSGADYTLGPAQLMTLGLAARILGMPPAAPAVVHGAVRATDEVWDRTIRSQSAVTNVEPEHRTPGKALVRHLVSLRRAGADRHDYARLASLSLLPPTLLSTEPATSGLVAVPRVLARRTKEASRLWVAAAKKNADT